MLTNCSYFLCALPPPNKPTKQKNHQNKQTNKKPHQTRYCFCSQYFNNLVLVSKITVCFSSSLGQHCCRYWFGTPASRLFSPLCVSHFPLFIEQHLHFLMLGVQYFRGLRIPQYTVLSLSNHPSFSDTKFILPLDLLPVSMAIEFLILWLYFPSVLWVKHQITELNGVESPFFTTLPEGLESSQRFLFISNYYFLCKCLKTFYFELRPPAKIYLYTYWFVRNNLHFGSFHVPELKNQFYLSKSKCSSCDLL